MVEYLNLSLLQIYYAIESAPIVSSVINKLTTLSCVYQRLALAKFSKSTM